MVYEKVSMLHKNFVDGQLGELNDEQGEVVNGEDAKHLVAGHGDASNKTSLNISTILDDEWASDSDDSDYEVENGNDASSSKVESDFSKHSELYNDLECSDDGIFADIADYG